MDYIKLAQRTIAMLSSMIESGECHTTRSREMKDNALNGLEQLRKTDVVEQSEQCSNCDSSIGEIKQKIAIIFNTKDIENIENILSYDDLGKRIKEVLRAIQELNLNTEETAQLGIVDINVSLLRKKAKEYAKFIYTEGYNDPIYHPDIMQTMKDFEAGFKAGLSFCNDR